MEKENKIFEVKSYLNTQGKIIRHLINIQNSSDFTYIGTIMLNSPNGPVPVEFEFPKENLSLDECFNKFEEYANSFVEKKINESRIVPAKINPKIKNGGNLIVP